MQNVIIIDKENIYFLRGEKKQSLYSILALHTLKCQDAHIYSREGNELILSEDCFGAAIKLFQKKLGITLNEFKIVLPHAITWFSLLDVEEIPKEQNEAEEFIIWKAQKIIPISPEQVIIRHQILSKNKTNTKLLITATFRSFIKSIETYLKKIGILPTFITPPTIAFLNIFENSLPVEGIICWLRETAYSMICFHEGIPVVIREVDREINLNRIEGELYSFAQSIKDSYPEYNSETVLYFDELQRNELKTTFGLIAKELDYKKLVQKIDSNIVDLPMYISALGLLE